MLIFVRHRARADLYFFERMLQCTLYRAQWPKSVDKSDFVGTAWNSSFSDHNRLTICSIVEIKSFSRAEFYK